ncbi:MAG: hypothetical protein Q8O38_00625 [Sulfurimicrobium sp.]|nr:hypothetical protein [Sulfurimicrobium sp.]
MTGNAAMAGLREDVCLTGMAMLPPPMMKLAMPVSLTPALSRLREREI